MSQTNIFDDLRAMYLSLSKSHQKIADYILENRQSGAFLSINDLSKATHSSPATITRFVRKLGCSGYAEFQRLLYNNQIQQAPFGEMKTLLRSACNEKDSSNALLSGINANMGILNSLYSPQLQKAFDNTCSILHKARNIYVEGQRSSYTTAYYLHFMLSRMYENVRLIDTSASVFPSQLSAVGKEDCLIVVSYSRYTKISYDIASFFHKEGAKVIALTDSATSPIALQSTEVLVAPNDRYFSPICALTVCTSLIAALSQTDAPSTLNRMEKQDKIALDHGVYL